MPAWTCRRYGGPEVLALEEVPVPPLRPGWVLIRVAATTVSTADARIRALRLPPGMGFMGRLALGWNGPRRPILGTEAVGTIAAVGQGVSAWRPGDAVVCFPDTRMGAHAALPDRRDRAHRLRAQDRPARGVPAEGQPPHQRHARRQAQRTDACIRRRDGGGGDADQHPARPQRRHRDLLQRQHLRPAIAPAGPGGHGGHGLSPPASPSPPRSPGPGCPCPAWPSSPGRRRSRRACPCRRGTPPPCRHSRP